MQPVLNRDSVFELVYNNPQLKTMVENTVKLNNMQHAAQQYAPNINVYANPTNPYPTQQTQPNQNMWMSPEGQQPHAQPPQSPQPPAAPQIEGGLAAMIPQALEIVNKFDGKLDILNNNMGEVFQSVGKLGEQMTEILDKLGNISVKEDPATVKTLGEIQKSMKSMSDELAKLAKKPTA